MTDVQYDADLHGRSFAQMQVFYTAQKKQFEPLSYEFLIAFGQSALREGRIRQAIERTREAISRAQTSRERSEAYLYLCRMYRVMLHMNNARSELHRAFDELRIPEPASRLSALLKALVFAVFDPRRPFARVLDTIDAEEVARRYALIMGLYVESGLSSYYLRKFVPFLQASLWSRVVFLFGPPAAKAEWAGGTGTVLAVLHFKSASDRLLNLTEDIARDIGSASVQAKTQIWRALSADYFGDPMRSAELFSKLAHERAQDLSTEDLGIVCTTLSNNYVIRGHTEESLRAIEALFTEYDRSCTLFFSCRKTFVEWYKIPALSFHGQNEEVETIIKTSRGIFSSVDEEKWQVAQ
ncbi:MAG: hypothetical protein Q7S95_04130, partial [bacterium]|nr:hypothetical protein [bacterium]